MSGMRLGLIAASTVAVGGLALLMLGQRIKGLPSGDEAKHAAMVFDVKQIGIAALQFGADHDDVMPDPSTFRQTLRPYVVKNSGGEFESEVLAALDRTNWKLEKVNQTQIPNIEKTVMASLDEADGSAVLYADGHSEWIGRRT